MQAIPSSPFQAPDADVSTKGALLFHGIRLVTAIGVLAYALLAALAFGVLGLLERRMTPDTLLTHDGTG